MAWTDLSAAASGTPPSVRMGHGFTPAGGKLFVHGGISDWATIGKIAWAEARGEGQAMWGAG